MFFKARFLYPSVTLNKVRAANTLKGKTILITGASFGIGESLARHLLQYEVTLILVARTMEKLLALESESVAHPAKVIPLYGDLCSEESIGELCRRLREFRIDYFISNAGKSIMRTFAESIGRTHDYRRTIAVNYLAPVQMISMLSENFKEAHTHIVNISTYNVLMKTPPNWSAYVSSKKAMRSWIQSNLAELKTINITVSNIYFPLVESRMKNMNKSYQHTVAMTIESAVNIAVKSLLKRGYHFYPWWHIPVQIGLFLLSPFWNFYWQQYFRRQNSNVSH